ncbi:hypothetical protein Scep_017000 [Stephania cephalantha]|uniref:Flavonoid 3'-monooxygenase n=1 Tax=Stephania cephalantha TaxID=152367 RepID=A0AAP0IQM6_9MAGN
MINMAEHLQLGITPTTTIFALLVALAIYLIIDKLIIKRKNHVDRLPLPPGPKPWPIIGNLPHLGSVPHSSLAEMARKYGPLMHLKLGSVHVVVAASASVASQFLKTHDANFAYRPPNAGAKYVAYNYRDLVFAPYSPRWRFLRKICYSHLFSPKALDNFHHIRQEEVAVLAEALARSSDGKVEVKLGDLLTVCVTNALGRVMLGFECLEKGVAVRSLSKWWWSRWHCLWEFHIGDFIPWLEWLDLQGLVAKLKKVHRRFDDFLNKIIEEHQSGCGTESHKDLLSMLIGLKRDGNGDGEGDSLDDIEIKALLLDPGTDTSSSTIEWALAEPIRHPHILARAQQELDSVVGRDRLVSDSDLSRLTYFQAIMKETFRLHPSTPLSIPHMSRETCEVNGYSIPKGSTLLVNVWAIARDPSIWSDPLEFRPERFLPGGAQANVDVKGNDFELIPFGAGRRICAGMSLGIRMIQLVVATLVHGFDWALPDSHSPEKLNMEETFGLTLQRAEPLMVRPRARRCPYQKAVKIKGSESPSPSENFQEHVKKKKTESRRGSEFVIPTT